MDHPLLTMTEGVVLLFCGNFRLFEGKTDGQRGREKRGGGGVNNSGTLWLVSYTYYPVICADIIAYPPSK